MRDNVSNEDRNNTANKRMRAALTNKSKGRSRITNGTDLLPNTDQRTFWCRRFKDLNTLLTSDLGGTEVCSEAEKALIRRACCLIVELERMEHVFAQHGAASRSYLSLYIRAAGTLRRILKTTGLQRRAKDVTPTLAQYLAVKEGAP